MPWLIASAIRHVPSKKMRGLFARATRGMALLRERAPDVRLVVNTVVSKSTAGTVKDLLSLPVLPDHLRVFPVGQDLAWLDSLDGMEENNWGEWAGEAKTEQLPAESLAAVRAELRGLVVRARELGVSLEVERLRHDGPFNGDCVVPMGHFVVQPNGDVFPCCHVQDEPNRFGSLATTSVSDLLGGEAYRDLLRRLRPARLPSCGRCSRYRGFNETAAQLIMIGMPGRPGADDA